MSQKKRLESGTVKADLEYARMARMPSQRWPEEIAQFEDESDQAVAEEVFAKVLLFRAPDDWSPTDIQVAAEYAQHVVWTQRLMRLLDRCGPLVRAGDRMKPNPLYTALQAHQAAAGKLSRRLGINIRSQVSNMTTVTKAGQEFRKHLANGVQVEGEAKPANGKSGVLGRLIQ